ncbi:uncharacterized protein LOC135952270 [Calliphora vicina]|uniref:uncharacterized protein LOC135952270 n=1 Tax=Calliphora vicina TaxID=7373 RepID=UPI00325C240B
MAAYTMLTIFMVFFLVELSLAKPLDDSSDLNLTPAQKIIFNTLHTFYSLGDNYYANAFNVSRNILKDESLMANDKPEVLEFKKNLTMFVENYDVHKDREQLLHNIEIYLDTIKKYTDIPEEKLNAESKFIAEIVKKYNTTKMQETIQSFMKNFDKLFEENKADLDKPMLEWYEKYSSLTDFKQKMVAFHKFLNV